jgi:hypothetical protein
MSGRGTLQAAAAFRGTQLESAQEQPRMQGTEMIEII